MRYKETGALVEEWRLRSFSPKVFLNFIKRIIHSSTSTLMTPTSYNVKFDLFFVYGNHASRVFFFRQEKLCMDILLFYLCINVCACFFFTVRCKFQKKKSGYILNTHGFSCILDNRGLILFSCLRLRIFRKTDTFCVATREWHRRERRWVWTQKVWTKISNIPNMVTSVW